MLSKLDSFKKEISKLGNQILAKESPTGIEDHTSLIMATKHTLSHLKYKFQLYKRLIKSIEKR
jgi:hypothetical protein